MKKLTNITTHESDTGRYKNNKGLKAFCQNFGLDGLEIMEVGSDEKGIIHKEDVVGFHLMHYPCWYCFWSDDRETLKEEFGREENSGWTYETEEEIRKNFGGTDRSAIIEAFRKNIDFAKHYEPEYVVFHVTDVLCCEAMSRKFRYTDEEIVDGAAELLNELFTEDFGFELLLENLWWPGLTMTRPEITSRLLEKVHYPRIGIMLDVGHLLHTNIALRTEAEAAAYLREVLDRYEDTSIIHGVHFHQTLEGAFVEEVKKHPRKPTGSYIEKCCEIMDYVYRLDHHNPFLNREAAAIIKKLDPAYLVFEFITESREQQEEWLGKQMKIFE